MLNSLLRIFFAPIDTSLFCDRRSRTGKEAERKFASPRGGEGRRIMIPRYRWHLT